MASFMRPFEAQAYAAFRIMVGLLFLWHGTQKLFGFPAAAPEMPAAMKYLAGGIELGGGVLVMIGLFTGWAAFLCSGLMAAAYWIAHGLKGIFPLQYGGNGGELAILYCFAFLLISARGAGIWSVDGSRSG